MLTVCVGCGCTDARPCSNLAGETCRWIVTESEEIGAGGLLPLGQLAGLCSNCVILPVGELLERYKARREMRVSL